MPSLRICFVIGHSFHKLTNELQGLSQTLHSLQTTSYPSRAFWKGEFVSMPDLVFGLSCKYNTLPVLWMASAGWFSGTGLGFTAGGVCGLFVVFMYFYKS